MFGSDLNRTNCEFSLNVKRLHFVSGLEMGRVFELHSNQHQTKETATNLSGAALAPQLILICPSLAALIGSGTDRRLQ